VEFVYKSYRNDGYSGTKQILYRIKEDALVPATKTFALTQSPERQANNAYWNYGSGREDPAPCFTTYVGKRRLFRQLHVPAVDCDSPESLELVRKTAFDIAKTTHVNVESSPGHYWVIFDTVKTWTESLTFLDKITGMDRRHIDMCRNYKRFMFRAFPKQLGFPRFPKRGPSNAIAGKWYWEVWNYFNSDLYLKVCTQMGIQEKECQNCKTQRHGKFCFECGATIQPALNPARPRLQID